MLRIFAIRTLEKVGINQEHIIVHIGLVFPVGPGWIQQQSQKNTSSSLDNTSFLPCDFDVCLFLLFEIQKIIMVFTRNPILAKERLFSQTICLGLCHPDITIYACFINGLTKCNL